MEEKLINSLAYNTQNGNVYVYLEETPYKRKKLYSYGNQWFVKNCGRNIFFTNKEDIEKIKEFLK